MAPPTQGTWRSNDYISAFRLVDACSIEWVVELFIYTFRWSIQICATTLVITSQYHILINITFTYVATHIEYFYISLAIFIELDL